MFDHKPTEPEWVSWLFAIIWTGAIFLTIPFVRLGTDFVEDRWGSATFTYAIALILVVVASGTLGWMSRRGAISLIRVAWLVGVTGVVVYLTFGLKAQYPVEAIHYLQYGFLGCLLYRAFAHRVADHSIYICVILAGALIGMIDEAIQWLVPKRYFSLGDIWLNVTAVAFVQIAIATSVRPKLISGWPDATAMRRLCHLSAVSVGMLGLFHLNTPTTIAVYSTSIPALTFVRDLEDIMIEFGHIYDDPDTGRFRSRLSSDELQRVDSSRAPAAAKILDQHGSRENYRDFIRTYTGATDPFMHEIRVHIYSRNVNVELARDDDVPDRRRLRFTSAYRENRILEKYFGETLKASASMWSEELRRSVKANAMPDHEFESLVSRHLITAYSPSQVMWLFGGAVISLLVLGQYFRSQTRRS